MKPNCEAHEYGPPTRVSGLLGLAHDRSRLGVRPYRPRGHDAQRLLEAAGILALGVGPPPILFVVVGGLVFFAWGEIYSLFP